MMVGRGRVRKGGACGLTFLERDLPPPLLRMSFSALLGRAWVLPRYDGEREWLGCRGRGMR